MIRHKLGKCSYDTLTNIKKVNHVEIDIYNKAYYTPTYDSVKELTIIMADDENTYRFQYLRDLLNARNGYEKELEKKKKEEEKKRVALEKAKKELEEALRKKQEEEAQRLQLETKRRREEEEKALADIERLENKIKASEENLKRAQSFIRQGMYLRLQHILDVFQEEAKRSHVFDGVPIVIEGGPGTGKTTTMIQRLKFLLSSESLLEYDAPLTDEQIKELTDRTNMNTNWLFFSPTQKLLSFLRKNMQEEELNANELNTTTLETYAKKILMDYRLRMPNSDGPFKLYRQQAGEELMILEPRNVVDSFEAFVVKKISSILLKISQLKTSDFVWHRLAVEIKAYCKSAESINDITALMNLFNSMQLNEKQAVAKIEKELVDIKNRIAVKVKTDVLADADMYDNVCDLFLDWEEDDMPNQDFNVNEDEFDDSEDEDEEADVEDYEAKLYKLIKPILRNLGLKNFDSKVKLTKRQQELYNIIQEYIDLHDLWELGNLEWFKKNFAFPCRGIESNIFNQIPKLYKEFRREQLKIGSTIYNKPLLEALLKKDSGKQIHREELELIVGFINNLILGVYKKSKNRFESMKKNKYVRAYLDNCKPVIGIDEATDYSLIDYYFITSFRKHEYSTITLCGDIMQGLNANGINNWQELNVYLPNLKVCELKESYRQLPTLLEMSKKMYRDEMNCEAPFTSTKIQQDNEPAPLCYISNDMEQKTRWMARRIIEIFDNYGGEMPSVAILVGENVDISEMKRIMIEQEILNGIAIEDCSENRESETTKCVRIFRLSDVKGMEFESVFFYDIDDALSSQSQMMMRRYLYVGVSRATSHLAATFTKEEGNEDILNYFDRTKKSWRKRGSL